MGSSKGFPSPCGVVVMNPAGTRASGANYQVSVPLRGSGDESQ